MTIAQKIAELAEALGVDIPNDGQIADNLNAITLAKGGAITSNTNIAEAIKNLANTVNNDSGESDDEGNTEPASGYSVNLLQGRLNSEDGEVLYCIIVNGVIRQTDYEAVWSNDNLTYKLPESDTIHSVTQHDASYSSYTSDLALLNGSIFPFLANLGSSNSNLAIEVTIKFNLCTSGDPTENDATFEQHQVVFNVITKPSVTDSSVTLVSDEIITD